ncbi:major facilitator superfamily domain-containing protein [Vararia minispora EC-137]|uniref:Major facilitator superfamily domain-containing protein n=1 Tax=Vararia minispora EC-137 TaxID=1314806 RepID=A0ACB8QFQ6_9AGAM|nr:major facilitator superfamily domain-containing protein [Vararia minispora EC-137]
MISERLPVPHVDLLPPTTQHVTPLPVLSIIVLSILLLGEFLTACVSMPFLLFMSSACESSINYFALLIRTPVSSFFLGQLLTSVLWASIASRYNPRVVLITSLAGATLTCFAFGWCTTYRAALATRFAQGLFAGAAGVARGCVNSVTDSTNASRAYAIISFFWGVGGVLGSVIGGTFESPAQKWPSVFGSESVLVDHPYILPTSIAASVTLIGAILSLFLAEDGGPRQRAPLLAEKSLVSSTVPPTTPKHQPLFMTPVSHPMAIPEDVERSPRFLRGYGSINFRDSSLVPRPRGISVEAPHKDLKRGISASRSSLRNAAKGIVERIAAANMDRVSSLSDVWVTAALNVEPLDGEDGNGDYDKANEEDHCNSAIHPQESDHTIVAQQTRDTSGSFYADVSDNVRPSRMYPGVPLPSRNYSISLTPTPITTTEPPRELGMDSLPWMILAQYGLLALHTVTHDMIFMSFLVSDYEHGGLNLTAANFSQLTALMCLFQIAYQFFLYPFLSTKLSHLAILRLGGLLFIPAYLGTTLLHFLAAPEDEWGGLDLGAGLILAQAIRYCGNTLSFTAIAILINCASPPPVIGLANGIGQGVVSLARFIGPILGGYIWSTSVDDNPNGFYIPFFTITSVVVFAIVNSLAV